MTGIAVAAGEAAADTTGGAPVEAQKSAVQTAVDAARLLIAKTAEPAVVAGAETTAATETPEEIAARAEAEEATLAANETPEQTEARHVAAEEAAAAAVSTAEPMVVKLPGVNPGEEFDLEVDDPETLAAINRLKKGYARREQAEAIRDEAQRIREETEDIRYAAELDPANIVLSAMHSEEDVDHLFRFLSTRAGVMERNREWAAGLLESPESIALQARMLDADRVTRREQVKGEIQEKMAFDTNARQLLGTLRQSVGSLAPDSMDDDGRALLERDVRQDIVARVNAQVTQYVRENNIPLDADGRPRERLPREVRMLDPRIVPGLIQRRFKLMGVAPKSASVTAAKGTPAPAPKGPGTGKAPLTAEALQAARTARRAGASAPPGAGSLVATLEKAPAYNPKVKGSAIQQTVDWWRARQLALSKRPQ